MISSELLICAEKALRDIEGGLSLINVLDDVTAESFPIVFSKLAVINFLKKGVDDGDTPNIRLHVFNNETRVRDYKIRVDFRGQHKTRAIIELGFLPIEKPGTVDFVILDVDNAVEIARYVVLVRPREEVVVN